VTIIDLGELTGTDFELPPRPPRSRPDLIRLAALAVVTLLTVAAVTASARTAPPAALRPLWTTPLASTDVSYLFGDTVFLNRMNENQDRATLTAYDAATGATRWSADAGPVNAYPDLVTAAGVLLQPVGLTEFRSGETTTSFTRTTASTVHAAGDTVLLNEYDAQGRATRLRLVRQRDGGTIWSRALVANGAVATSDDTVVTIDDHGAVTVLRWADGSVLRTGTVPWTPDRLPDGVHNDVSIAGGALILGRWDQQATKSAVYRLDTLAESWHSDGYVGDCEPVLCSSEDDGVVVGRDPLTGAERWRLRQVSGAYAIGSGRLLSEAVNDTDGRQLIDARTGRTIATLGPGQLPLTLGQVRGPLLLVRSKFEGPLHVTVLQVDRATGTEFTLGALGWMGDGNAGCQAAGRYLICPGHDRLYVAAVG
jgi:outer membrane protein assembly factor BamB